MCMMETQIPATGRRDTWQDSQRHCSQYSGYHAAYRFIEDEEGEGVYTEQAALVYHTDEEMNELAAKVDVRIPWER